MPLGLGVTPGDGLPEPPGVAFGPAALLAVRVAACDVVGDEHATGVGHMTPLASLTPPSEDGTWEPWP